MNQIKANLLQVATTIEAIGENHSPNRNLLYPVDWSESILGGSMDAVNHASRASVAYLHHLRIGNGFAKSVVSRAFLVTVFLERVNIDSATIRHSIVSVAECRSTILVLLKMQYQSIGRWLDR